MTRELDRKLRLTAAALGIGSCKDLVQAFRQVNPRAAIDIERTYKWLQGRASPRDPSIYRDWGTLTGLDRPPGWLADCAAAELAAALAQCHGLARAELEERAATFGAGRGSPGSTGSGAAYLAGTYVVYSLAWSPYYAGRLIRGTLELTERGRDRLEAVYRERLPTGEYALAGRAVLWSQLLMLQLIDRGGVLPMQMTLHRPSPPASLLGGLISGATLVGPEPAPSVSRLIAFRTARDAASVAAGSRYLEPGESLRDDLGAAGCPVKVAGITDADLDRLLRRSGGHGLDQMPRAALASLVERLDRVALTAA